MPTENIFQDGPYLSAALICERVLDEKDGVKSLIRIVSRLTRSIRGTDVPEKMPPIFAKLAIYISIKTGNKAGKHTLKIEFTRPDKTNLPSMSQSINLEPPESRGHEFIINMNLALDQEGVFWFDVYLDDLLMTKIPLTIRYITQTAGKNQTPPAVQ